MVGIGPEEACPDDIASVDTSSVAVEEADEIAAGIPVEIAVAGTAVDIPSVVRAARRMVLEEVVV